MNVVILSGRLARDCETRWNNDLCITRFTLAVDGESKENQADFIPVVTFGKTAENCEKYLAKGSQCIVHGRIKTGSYKNKEGKTVYTTDVNASRVEFVGSRVQKEEPNEVQEKFRQVEADIPF